MFLSFKYFNNNIYLPDQSDSELSADFVRMVTVRSPERTSGSEAERKLNTYTFCLLFSDSNLKSCAMSLHVPDIFGKT